MRDIQKYRYVVAALLVVLVFSLGFLISNLADNTRASSLRNELQQDVVRIESRQLQLSYLESQSQSCDALEAGLNNIVKGYNERLGKVQQYQDNSLLSSQRFETIKHQYIVSGIRYWLFAQQLRKKCEYSPNTVLFFTTDLQKTDCSACEKEGQQLTLLKQVHQNQVLVFSVPVKMDDGLIKILERTYNVTETPTVVVNGNDTLAGYHSRSEIEKHLKLEN